MTKDIIVIIGGPGSGKSTLIDGLTHLGYCCYPEISRQVILDAKQQGIDQLFKTEPLLFSKMLLEGRINQFKNAENEPHEKVFLDRGIPDVLAYMHFIGDDYPDSFHQSCEDFKYTKAFILPPWQEIYVSDNERYESFEQAQEINKHLISTYEKYGYNIVEVPKDTLENRINFILDRL